VDAAAMAQESAWMGTEEGPRPLCISQRPGPTLFKFSKAVQGPATTGRRLSLEAASVWNGAIVTVPLLLLLLKRSQQQQQQHEQRPARTDSAPTPLSRSPPSSFPSLSSDTGLGSGPREARLFLPVGARCPLLTSPRKSSPPWRTKSKRAESGGERTE
ncbi:unnamed protein product, partial [Lampetra fluviatilis]